MKREVEIWKEYPIQHDFEGFYRIEVSNKGNLKTYSNRFPEGNLVEGSTQGGFRVLRAKLKKKWSDADRSKIDKLNEEIEQLSSEIRTLKNNSEHREHVAELRQLRDRLIQTRKKKNAKLTVKNTINLTLLFHKLVAELFLESPENEDYKFIIHKDFDKLNNAVENLAWATQKDLDERLQHHPKVILQKFVEQFGGEKRKPNVGATKLSEMDVLRIKKRLKKGDTLRHLAQHYKVSDMQIHRIKTGENWSHVQLLEDIIKEK